MTKDVAALEQRGMEIAREIQDFQKRCDAAKKNWQR